MHKPVGFDTSSFALANTAIVISSNIGETIAQRYWNALGYRGKPLGIYLLSLLAVSLGICKLP
jgi:NhaA family Na+:H+ antiporter